MCFAVITNSPTAMTMTSVRRDITTQEPSNFSALVVTRRDITTQETSNFSALVVISVVVPVMVVILAVMLGAVIAAAILLGWRRGHKQGSREIYTPSVSKEVLQKQTSEQSKIVVSYGLQDVKEGWRSSMINEQQIELPVQNGVPVLEIVV